MLHIKTHVHVYAHLLVKQAKKKVQFGVEYAVKWLLDHADNSGYPDNQQRPSSLRSPVI